MIPSFQEENGYGIPGNDGKQRMEAGRAKNQIPYCTVVLVALNVILFSDRTDPAQSRRMDGIGGLLPAWCIFSMSTAGFTD